MPWIYDVPLLAESEPHWRATGRARARRPACPETTHPARVEQRPGVDALTRSQRGHRAAGLAGGATALRRRGDPATTSLIALSSWKHEGRNALRMVAGRGLTACRAVGAIRRPDHPRNPLRRKVLPPWSLYECPQREHPRTDAARPRKHLFDHRPEQPMVRDMPGRDHHFALCERSFEIMDVGLARRPFKSPDLLRDLGGGTRLSSLATVATPSISGAPRRRDRARIDHAFGGLNELPGEAGHHADRQRVADTSTARISIPAAPANSVCRPITPGSSTTPRAASVDHRSGRRR